ncbi:right-handed parallel beta-helix repeat-containing protein [Roseibium sediminicola]|uniref:Right-handed parallel beta-helix repeat-containing protein n=1 Tax=Roseibium sediminicola TaxID=2933272 RepID=A0ABT0GXK1_9HYPH|nr:right-handed parallel beta-helix repeat-containing protein [Roseibium sp. CAU 1639]MCK7614163.1 right-handed parallel beta-helix repeat-containing protein [Roseibium sp. CAU 1639]
MSVWPDRVFLVMVLAGMFALPLAAARAATDLAELQVLDRSVSRLADALQDDRPVEHAALRGLGLALFELEPRSGETPAISDSGPNSSDFNAANPAMDNELSFVPIDLVLSQLSLQTGSNHHIELKAAQTSPGAPVLVLRTGHWTLDILSRQLEELGKAGVLSRAGQVYRASLPIVIWHQAELAVSDGQTLILDGQSGAFLVNSGLFTLEQSVLKGAGGNAEVEDYRPFVLTALGGRTHVAHSTLSDLGFGDRPHLRGLSFVSSDFFPRKSRVLIRDNRIERVFSVELSDMEGGLIENNLVLGARGSGIRIQRSRNTVIRANTVASSEAHGIVLAAGASKALVADNLLVGNARAGVFSGGGVVSSQVAGNVVVGNDKSGIFLRGTGCVDIRNNLVAHNGLWGIAAKRSFSVSVKDNLLARNTGPGLVIGESVASRDRHRISGNRFFANRSGFSADAFVTIEMSGNDFSGQRPILFSGELKAHTARYLRWSEVEREGDLASVFLARSAHPTAPADREPGELAVFSVTELANCKP